MASEKDANEARTEHSEFLRQLGAHAIAVDEVKRGGEKTFAVVAYLEEKPTSPVPKRLEVRRGKKKVEVPLAIKKVERFRPE